MSVGMSLSGRFNFGRKTENAGTKIVLLIPPRRGLKTVITKIVIATGATAHVLTILRPLKSTTITAAALASQAVVVAAADPGISFLGPNGSAARTANNALAGSDRACIELPDGTYLTDLVSAVPGAYPGNVTMTTNLPTNGVAADATFWNFGVEADTDPKTAAAHLALALAASGDNVYEDEESGVISTFGAYEPLLLIIDNGTNASTILQVAGGYSKF